jgi:serine/threonine-protein kinase
VQGIDGTVTAVGTGYRSTCVVAENQVLCWGRGDFGQLGNGDTLNSTEPVVVRGLPGGVVSDVVIGDWHACAVVDGRVFCWGSNGLAQLGLGVAPYEVTPVPVAGLPSGATQ